MTTYNEDVIPQLIITNRSRFPVFRSNTLFHKARADRVSLGVDREHYQAGSIYKRRTHCDGDCRLGSDLPIQ